MHDNGMPPGFPNKNSFENFVQKPNSRANGYNTFGKAYSPRPLLPETKASLISYPDYRFYLMNIIVRSAVLSIVPCIYNIPYRQLSNLFLQKDANSYLWETSNHNLSETKGEVKSL